MSRFGGEVLTVLGYNQRKLRALASFEGVLPRAVRPGNHAAQTSHWPIRAGYSNPLRRRRWAC